MVSTKTRKRKSIMKSVTGVFAVLLVLFSGYRLGTAYLFPALQAKDAAPPKSAHSASAASKAPSQSTSHDATEDARLPTSLLLVNSQNLVPSDYDIELTMLSDGHGIHALAYPYLEQMFAAAHKVGIYPMVVSGFRTVEQQQSIMDDYIANYMADGYSRAKAEKLAAQWVAQPGTSEHHLGLAVDINADPARSTDGEVYLWLAENAYRFGFILRYPEDKTHITGIGYEPWHYRFVGVEQAARIHAHGGCLEEYLQDAA